jgi:uncharacterized protein with ParB-like and HNH nuclease domain
MDVTPDKQSIDKVFSGTTYYIDFYQRQYKWTTEPVQRLLDDIFYRFNIEYDKFKDSSVPIEKLVEQYSWYYLNTYVTNTIDGKEYVVDGQQRLTTITLVLIKLYHLARSNNSSLHGWISTKIAGQSGYARQFWMNHEKNIAILDSLYSNDSDLDSIDVSAGTTSVNMVGNYRLISKHLNNELIDLCRLESFIFYFLKRLVVINLNVSQTDVPMIFEVINDRGVRLKPHEILKGKLLGEVAKNDLEDLALNDTWDTAVNELNSINEDEIDNFFVYYLRSKFANTIGEARQIDGGYHRVIFQAPINDELKLLHNPAQVKKFIPSVLVYYTTLYKKIYTLSEEISPGCDHIYYNKINEMDSQYLLILAACKPEDPEEDLKIKIISRNVDRLFSLLSLQRSYDSNAFTEATYQIASRIRDKAGSEIESVFEDILLELLAEARGVRVTVPLSYGLFKDTGIELSKRFKRYFFARVEDFIASNTVMNMRHTIRDLVTNTGAVNGFHIEHILSENLANKALFGNDDELFERERNRLGGLLLLKGKDNISSSNETYTDKLRSYANTLYWNETLRTDTYKSKLAFSRMISKYNLSFRPMDTFGPNELEERHKLLYDISSFIWR